MSTTSSKTAIITGGATDVGRATASQLAALGYAVAVVYSRSGAEAEQTVRDLAAAGSRTLAIQAALEGMFGKHESQRLRLPNLSFLATHRKTLLREGA